MWKDRKRFHSINFDKMDKYCLSRRRRRRVNHSNHSISETKRKTNKKSTFSSNFFISFCFFFVVEIFEERFISLDQQKDNKIRRDESSEREISKLLNTNKQIINRIEKRLSRHHRTVWNEHTKIKISKLKSKWFSDLCVSSSFLLFYLLFRQTD